MDQGMYRVEMTVTVPRRLPTGAIVWVPCPAYDHVTFTELVRGPAECGPLAETISRPIGRRLQREDCYAFRLAVRGVTSGFLCAMGEWHRRDMGQFEQAYVWAADWDDVPAACLARLRPIEGSTPAFEHRNRFTGLYGSLAA